jgi:alkanesulfonate monooxygenase SsuD/methylene tetrahydromethanopterin reductase-like flavin-dependent oxidoreductase (luciferase family)
MRFGFGMITCQQYPGDSRTEATLYKEALALSREAERLGFDSVWLTEHHFVDDGYLSACLVTAAAIAAVTERIAIGTGVLLAPFHHPLRLAEDAATVDLISGGRLILGLGQGWRAEEFEAFGVAPKEGGRTLRAAIRTLRQAWSPGLVDGVDVFVTPKPAQPGGPPIWLGGFSEPAARRAARIADGFIGPRAAPEIFERHVSWVKDELEKQGRDPSSFRFSVLVPTFAWEEGPAWPVVRQYSHFVKWKYDDMSNARSRTGSLSSPPSLQPEVEEQLLSMAVVGTPDEVVERFQVYEALAGGEVEVVARLYWPGMDLSLQREAMQVFAERVIWSLR